MQWMQNPSQSNEENLNKVRRDDRRHFRNKKKGYLEAKIEELGSNSKIKILRTCFGESVNSRKGTSQEII
jgi:hypothetical protein